MRAPLKLLAVVELKNKQFNSAAVVSVSTLHISNMPSANTILSNCYTPLPAQEKGKHVKEKKQFINPTSRSSGVEKNHRNAKSIRHVCIDRHVLSNSTGSSLVELGHTKILCAVHGPRPFNSVQTNDASVTSGVLSCQVRFAQKFGQHSEIENMTHAKNLDGYSSSFSNISSQKKEVELSSRLHDAIAPSLPLELLMKNVVEVFVMILQNDGSILPASVVAASLALADAGVEVYDLVSAFSVAVIPRSICEETKDDEDNAGVTTCDNGQYSLLADPTTTEILSAEGVVTMGMMKNWKEVVFWHQTGSIPPSIVSEAGELCKEGCTAMHNFMRQSLTSFQDTSN